MNKTLVCYFSATGTTAKIGNAIAAATNADTFEIEPEVKYTAADLIYTDKKSRSTIEMNDLSFRPAVKNKASNLEQYDKIVLGFPVWWYREPTIVDTFLDENNLEGKDIYVYVTSGGSGASGSLDSLKAGYPNLNFISAKRFISTVDAASVKEWLGL